MCSVAPSGGPRYIAIGRCTRKKQEPRKLMAGPSQVRIPGNLRSPTGAVHYYVALGACPAGLLYCESKPPAATLLLK